jgi:N-glycosylase/DNA lyase
MKILIDVPAGFNFLRTVYSHGWCSLPPFQVEKESAQLQRVIELPVGKAAVIRISQPARAKMAVDVDGTGALGAGKRREIVSQVRSCFRLDEDYSEFYRIARSYPAFRWVPKIGAGRLLRAPTVFEDVVKMICTTNCSWALTEIMVANLCKKMGVEVDDGNFTFPRPETVAESTEKFLRKEIRAGYRAPYLLELSRRIARNGFDVEAWRHSDLPTNELYDLVRSVKGIGPYAAGNILKLLGRYDYLGIDSWCRKQFFEIHKNGRRTTDRVIEKFYEQFGEWKGLFFWMDVTKEWYERKFPF